jgi:hypothetical protein
MSDYSNGSDVSPWALGFISFAAFMLILAGFFHATAGLVGIIDDEFYVTTPNYVFEFDRTAWGWIHLIAGIIAVCAGLALFSGATWARLVGTLVAMFSAIAAFANIPYYPVWSIIIIAVDAGIIWALVAHGREFVEER